MSMNGKSEAYCRKTFYEVCGMVKYWRWHDLDLRTVSTPSYHFIYLQSSIISIRSCRDQRLVKSRSFLRVTSSRFKMGTNTKYCS